MGDLVGLTGTILVYEFVYWVGFLGLVEGGRWLGDLVGLTGTILVIEFVYWVVLGSVGWVRAWLGGRWVVVGWVRLYTV